MTAQQTADPTIQQLFDLTGKVALISGAGGYLGSAFSQALAEAGASVIASSRNQSRAKKVAESLPSPGGATHWGVEIDHMDEASLHAGFEDALKCAGRIDILVNNGHDALGKDWTTCTYDEVNRQLGNATGYFELARLVHGAAVKRKQSASIILLGSMYGVVGSYPDAYEGVSPASPVSYQALKGAIVHMTRHLAVYWAKDNVRVNCLSPGPFPSEKAPREMVDRLCTKSPMGRMGLPWELKGALIFLAGNASSYVTGQNLLVDGGWTAW